MSFTQTVLAQISPEDMGITYCHDHIFFIPPPPYYIKDPTLRLDDIEKSKKEIEIFKMAGGGCVVEMSTVETGRSPLALKKISIATGVHIVAATGFNKSLYCESVIEDQTVKNIAATMIKELTIGISESDVRAGVIKASSSKNMFSAGEEKVFTAAALAHQETGAPVSTHTEDGTMALEQIQRLTVAKVEPNHIIIGHLDRKLEWNYLLKVAETGVFMGFDQLSKEKYYPDILRITMIKKLIKKGYVNQIMLSTDLARMSYHPSYGFGYGPGYTYILWRFVPWMLEEGISREDVEKILIKNPEKAFSWKE